MIYSERVSNINILNVWTNAKNQEEFARLNQIKKMTLIGISEREGSENIISVFGYVELKNKLIIFSEQFKDFISSFRYFRSCY